MSMDREVYGALSDLQTDLRNAELPSAPLPGPEAVSRLFAVWFAVQAFLFMQMIDRAPTMDRRVPGGVAESMRRVGHALGRLLGMEIPSPPEGSRLFVASSFFSMGAAAVGGDNWCQHSPGVVVPMEVYRNFYPPGGALPSGVSEFEMTCSHGHTTEYGTQSGGVISRNRRDGMKEALRAWPRLSTLRLIH